MSATSNRARALAYANTVKDRKQSRRATQPDTFGKAKSGPPSYAFQDEQRGPVDDTAEETSSLRQQEKDIVENKEEDVIDAKDFAPAPKTGKAPQKEKSSSGPAAAQVELKSAFAKCWTIVDDIDIPAVYHDEKSSYFPNSISVFEVLSNMEEILSGNEELRWVSPNYFSLPVRVYYAVIFYVQCLRAKEQAGTLRKSEGSWLRAFFRRYKDTMCPVAGPLVPIFSNIVAVLPDDDQFDYVYPSIPQDAGTYAVVQTTATPPVRTLGVSTTHYLFPSVPLVASLLRDFCISPTLTTGKFDSSGAYVPFTLQTGGTFAGVTFAAQSATHHNASISQLLSNPAISHPLPEGKERLKEIHGFWKRSKARHVPDISATTAYSPSGPNDLTLLAENLDWFQPCVDMANVQVKFFSDSTNLSAIPTVGGMSSTIVADISFPEQGLIPDALDDWYPDVFSSAKAKFSATAAELNLDHKYAAAYALTNATLSWHDVDNHPIGGIDSVYRTGPYWQNTKETFKLEHEVPVMTGIYTMLQTQFYDAHGKA